MSSKSFWIQLFLKEFILYVIGGFSYVLIEILWRGRSHYSMFFLGGFCFILVGGINNLFSWKTPLLLQGFLGTIIITLMEFVCGIIVNKVLLLNVWDYSNLPLNLIGQICLPYSLLWFLLSFLIIYIDDLLRWKLFQEEKPHYIFI